MKKICPSVEESARLHGVVFLRKLSELPARAAGALLLADRVLPKKCAGFRAFAERFSAQLFVAAGEQTKALRSFPALFERLERKLAELDAPPEIHVVGGGSLTDVGGFVASVLRRGVPLVLYPSTWLAAIDSAHGGKTALNSRGRKNQLGTFYPAARIYLVEELLRGQPKSLVTAARGEAVKMALLDGGAWAHEFLAAKGASLWSFLPELVAAKYRVVDTDPREEKGLRRVLNLGHTVGHVVESVAKIPHGTAVGYGLWFAVRFSRSRGLLSEVAFRELTDRWLSAMGIAEFRDERTTPLSAKAFRAALAGDKKSLGAQRVAFVFLTALGRPVVQSVAFDEVLAEARRQGIVREAAR